MICVRCGHSMPDGSLTCEKCGTYLGKYSGATIDTGVRAIRQGRVSASTPTLPPQQGRVREYGDYELSSVPVETPPPKDRHVPPMHGRKGSSRPDTRRGVPVKPQSRAPHVKHKVTHRSGIRQGRVNWMLVGLAIFLTVAIVGGGVLVYLSRSESGRLAAARRNALSASETFFELARNSRDPLVQDEREALLREWTGVEAQYYWQAGQDYLDVGDVQTAITTFRIGDVVDPENYDGLLLLANAYELNAEDDKAEQVYLTLANQISPFRTEAYTALIRMYQAQSRRPEAAEMMKLAYANTDKEAYRLEREDYIPKTPQTDLNAGRYEISKLQGDVHLTSPQGYDIYYTTDDDAVLPQDGILSTDGAFIPQEGTVTLRAVCVSGDLVSDPLKVTYTFFYPSPPAPKCNLAPNTYKSLREVSLRPGEILDETMTKKEKEEAATHYRYFYTIDGSTPDENSPEYTGEPIKLPSGRVKLKAVCVNQYGKMSSILEVGYKFEVKPYPLEVYGEEDIFAGFTLNQTNIEEFKAAFGQPLREVESSYLGLTNETRHLDYDWGYAVFILNNNAWELVRISMNRTIGNPPRGIGFGMTEEEVVAAYRDFGQAPNRDGSRGLYYDYPNVGKIRIESDGTRVVEYACTTAASNIWVLQYRLGSNGRVNQIIHYYQP